MNCRSGTTFPTSSSMPRWSQAAASRRCARLRRPSRSRTRRSFRVLMRSRRLLPAFFIAAQFVSVVRALVVYGGDGTQNTTAPGNGAPWDHVGTIGGATGVYLGSFGGGSWVITANHVGVGDFTLGGTTYAPIA